MYLKWLSPDDVHTISSVISKLWSQSQYCISSRISTIVNNNDTDWKEIISKLLVTISFEDLTNSLATCDSFEKFFDVWDRIIFNARLWKALEPRVFDKDKSIYVVTAFNDAPDVS